MKSFNLITVTSKTRSSLSHKLKRILNPLIIELLARALKSQKFNSNHNHRTSASKKSVKNQVFSTQSTTYGMLPNQNKLRGQIPYNLKLKKDHGQKISCWELHLWENSKPIEIMRMMPMDPNTIRSLFWKTLWLSLFLEKSIHQNLGWPCPLEGWEYQEKYVKIMTNRWSP